MSYVNVGARVATTGVTIKTKRALKEAIASDPKSVTLYGTSESFVPGNWTCDKLNEGVTYSVCGPDPYNDRRWYANIKNVNGKVTVS